MKVSFKLKIAALSFIVSGALLSAFGIVLFAFVYSSSIDRMDSELQALVEGPMRGSPDPAFWQRFGNSLEFIMEETSSDRIELLVLDAEKNILLKTTNAPPELETLPLPELPPEPVVEMPTNNAFSPFGYPMQTGPGMGYSPFGSPAPGGPGMGYSPFGSPAPGGPANGYNAFGNPAPGGPANSYSPFGNPMQTGPGNDYNPFGSPAPGGPGIGDSPFGGPAPAGPGNGSNRVGGFDREERPPMQQGRSGRGRGDSDAMLRRGRNQMPTAILFQTLKTEDAKWRVGILRNQYTTSFAAMDMNTFNMEINRYRNTFLLAGSLGLLLLGGAGWFLAGRAMKPIAVIAKTAEGITARGLNQRIPQVGTDVELQHLVTVANSMLDRLEKSYNQAVRFSADAAHELQTPLTILQGELDNAIQSAEDGSQEQQRYGMLLEELRNLKSVVHKLLLLSHADEGRLNLNLGPVDLSEMVSDAAEDIQSMAPGLSVELHIPDRIMVSADRALLNQTLRNMISNAAKYSPDDGRVVFKLGIHDQSVVFTLLNTAPPIPDEDRPLLFTRFHRVEKSRTTAGSGLGLSLAREIARAHGGELELDPYTGEMVSFTLSLPIAQN